MKYLLDTCVVSDLVKPAPNGGLQAWLSRQPEEHLFLSVITLGGIQAGISKLPDSSRKAMLTSWVTQDLLKRFSGRILAVDTEVALTWGIKRGESAARGSLLPLADAQIAATAIVNGMTVVTRNVADIERCGAMTLNPWS